MTKRPWKSFISVARNRPLINTEAGGMGKSICVGVVFAGESYEPCLQFLGGNHPNDFRTKVFTEYQCLLQWPPVLFHVYKTLSFFW